MDIVFNHCVGVTALQNGQPKRLRFGSNEKVADVAVDGSKDVLTLQARSHHDIVLADGTVLKAVPVSAFRFEPSHTAEATTKRSNAKAEHVSASK